MIALLLPLAALATAPAPPKTLVFDSVEVTAVVPAGAGCGIRKVWGAFDFTSGGVTARAYVPCAAARDLPQVGAHCSLTVTVTTIDGQAPDVRSPDFAGYVVDSMTCYPAVGEGATAVTGAVIQEYGPMPTAGSGVFMFLRSVIVAMPAGEKRTLYFIHGGRNVYLTRSGHSYPTLGATCDFATKTHHISGEGNLITGDGGPDAPEGEVIVEASCR